MTLKYRIVLKLKKNTQNLLILLSRKKIIKSSKKFSNFIILTRSRSGSNLIVSFLDSHPNIYIRGEVFHNLNNRDYKNVLGWFFNIMPAKFKASGFKLFYYHPLDTKCPELWKELVDNKEIKIIHLHRENLIKTIVSRGIALKTDIWSSENKENKSVIEFEMAPEDIESEINKTLNWRKEFGKLFINHQVLELSYEDFVNNKPQNLDLLQEFLAVPNKTLFSHLKKQQKKPLEEVLNNYDEIKKYFEKTSWKKYLH